MSVLNACRGRRAVTPLQVLGAGRPLNLVSGVQVYVQWGLTTLAALLTLAYSAVSSHVPYRPAASKQQKGEREEPLLKHQHPAPCRLRLMVRGLHCTPIVVDVLWSSKSHFLCKYKSKFIMLACVYMSCNLL